jgi:hypothetical protein
VIIINVKKDTIPTPINDSRLIVIVLTTTNDSDKCSSNSNKLSAVPVRNSKIKTIIVNKKIKNKKNSADINKPRVPIKA